MTGVGEFTAGVWHFVERHGLAVIVVLGESITEVGAATARQGQVSTAIAGGLLALVLTAAMWSLYLGGEERQSEVLLERAADATPRQWSQCRMTRPS